MNGPDDFIIGHGLQEMLALINNAEHCRLTITLHPGKSPEAVDAAEDMLVARAESLRMFQRGGEIVRVITLVEPKHSNGLRRKEGTVQLAPLRAVALAEILDRNITWQKEKASKHGLQSVRIDCRSKIAASYLSRVGSWRLPVLTGINSAPIMRPDGNVVGRAGYDPATGLLLTEDWSGDFNRTPTREEAVEALAALEEPYSEFPFVSDADKSVLLAGILTALQRRLLDSAPLFGFSAPSQRTGKSLLAGSVAIIATGKPAPAMAVSGDAEELRKAVFAALREGHNVVNLDDIERPLLSPHLSRAITQSEYSDRILGESKLVRFPTNLLWTATGNNLSFRGDLAVRALVTHLDAQMERPEERAFIIPDLKQYIADHRRKFTVGGLTVLRAYAVAGRPDQGLQPWGGFDEWSRTVRSSLIWLGKADPCITRQQVIEDDPDREQAAALLSAWDRATGDDCIRVSELVVRADSNTELRASLLPVAADRKGSATVEPGRVGWWCRDWCGQVVGGLSVVRGKDYGKSATWRVVRSRKFGISGIRGVANTSPKISVGVQDSLPYCEPDSNRAATNPTNPTIPKIDSGEPGHADDKVKLSVGEVAKDVFITRPTNRVNTSEISRDGDTEAPTKGWEAL